MHTTPNLFSKFTPIIRQLSPAEIDDRRAARQLLLDRTMVAGREIELVYAPFDHVNPHARLVIVGLTPGKQKAVNALRAAHNALGAGLNDADAAELAKVYASFFGPMRRNLVSMLDPVWIARWLRLATTTSLWLRTLALSISRPCGGNPCSWTGKTGLVPPT